MVRALVQIFWNRFADGQSSIEARILKELLHRDGRHLGNQAVRDSVWMTFSKAPQISRRPTGLTRAETDHYPVSKIRMRE